LEQLDSQHKKIVWNENEPIPDLSRKCELARIEMRNYDREIKVLEVIPRIIECWDGLGNDSDSKQLTLTEFLTATLFEWIHKNEMKEQELRQILRALKLPEDKVVTIRGYKYTYYRIAKNDADKANFVNESQTEKLRRKYRLAINKALKPFEQDFYVYLAFDDKKVLKQVSIEILREIDGKTEKEKTAIMNALSDRGFRIKGRSWAISGIKERNLTGQESIKELQNIAIAMIRK
jgi:hypothetical protein